MRRLLRIGVVVAAAVLAFARPAAAHPLGNFTVNHLSRITVERDAVRVRYVLDLAEIPAFALDRSLDAHGTPSQDALDRWAQAHAQTIAPQLSLTVDGRSAELQPASSAIHARPGAGGLPTLYFTAAYAAAIGAGAHRIEYRDRTEPGRLGWKDVVTGTTREPTAELRAYPNALIGSPRARTALAANVDAAGHITVDANAVADNSDADGAAASAPLARSNALSDVLAKGASDPLVVIGALLIAIALGALHALEPGHGKTLLAVSLVGARATPRQALILAAALTVAHTAGVLALGLVVLAATHWIVPEQVYPWLTLGSGIVVTIIGGRALAREVRLRLPFAHAHAHAHPHAHPHAHDHVHDEAHAHLEEHHHDRAGLDDAAHARAHAIPGTAPLTFRGAVLAAASGNIAPCPAALVVLLAAIALHRVGYGLALIVAFSVGLAAVLTILGIAVVRSAAWLVARPQFDRVARFAPLVTSFVIATIGAVMVGQGFAAQGVGAPVPLVAALVLLAIVGYALAWHQYQKPTEAHA
ncbi:MAG: nickel/cobalt transporter (NicO) family protein [Candidatus Eremiobacteraeota bacterium]|jgi:ABC-type nickel/cobalt efflux system permease component RcnA|nr:nickel/cobalt transporter (NicO) family protein [Candidatus Eremiobacteraeota bacterium]